MRLSTIYEGGALDPDADPCHEVRAPRNWREASTLFDRGLRLMRARDDARAYRLFQALCRYRGDAPPDLLRAARAAREYLDPRLPAEEKAKALFGIFSPTLIRVYDAEGDEVDRPA
jgi:hypothetical protein